MGPPSSSWSISWRGRDPPRQAPRHMDTGLAQVCVLIPRSSRPERIKGRSKPCWTPFPISRIIRFEDGCRTMDIGSWLRSLGLGQYEATFRDNKIAADLLPRLTDAGLKDVGVSALGDRLRLLDAIAALASAKPLANSAFSRRRPRRSRVANSQPNVGRSR
jgi:hypothetical protein